jgi:hypothetical protein
MLKFGKSYPCRDLNTTGVSEFLRSHRGSSLGGSARIVLQLSKLPDHGYIVINGVKSRAGQSFLQSDVDRGFVTYHHDHSDTVRDSFGVAIFLAGDRIEPYGGEGSSIGGDVMLYNGLWNVTILSVNDQKFREEENHQILPHTNSAAKAQLI